jgi:hypothetical protein
MTESSIHVRSVLFAPDPKIAVRIREPTMGIDNAALIKEIDALVGEGRRLEATFVQAGYTGRTSEEPQERLRAFFTMARAAVERICTANSTYFADLPRTPEIVSAFGWSDSWVATVLGVLVALRNAIKDGYLVSLENRLRANVYDDFLVQAEELLKAGYHVAAMVLAGGVLEDHLRKLCEARSLGWTGNGSLSKYNDLLRDKPNAYDTATWRRIQSIGDDRNKAAHGQGEQVKREDVADHLKYVHRLLADRPA